MIVSDDDVPMTFVNDVGVASERASPPGPTFCTEDLLRSSVTPPPWTPEKSRVSPVVPSGSLRDTEPKLPADPPTNWKRSPGPPPVNDATVCVTDEARVVPAGTPSRLWS